MNRIFNEDCLATLARPELVGAVDMVMTSPPYNTSRASASDPYGSRYDVHSDGGMTDGEYIAWIKEIFGGYGRVLRPNGCVAFNISYSSENPQLIWLLVADIIRDTEFTTADCLVWKKSCALPNNRSPNKLTRIVEYVFVFCRKTEIDTFSANKKVVSLIGGDGQKNYENVFNFITARNNDANNDLNKATFSSEFVEKVLNIYAMPNSLVYDSFMGTGTTAVACVNRGHRYVGSEISAEQCAFAESRIASVASVLPSVQAKARFK